MSNAAATVDGVQRQPRFPRASGSDDAGHVQPKTDVVNRRPVQDPNRPIMDKSTFSKHLQ